MDPHTAVVNPRIIPGDPKGLRLEGKTSNSILLNVNRESRYGLLQSPLIITLTDTVGPTAFHFHPVKDTIILLGLGFLRSKSLPNFDKIAAPFARIKRMAIPWTCTGWSEAHIKFMPSIFQSLETLTLLGLKADLEVVAQKGHQYKMKPITEDFRHHSEMVERKGRLENVFRELGRKLDIELKLFAKPPKKTRARRG